MWHDMAIIILCFWSPSPKYCHDLHCYRHDTMISIILIFYQRVVTWSSRQLLLLQLLLSHSDEAKQLFGACILCNNETTVRLLPIVDIKKDDHLIQQCISHHIFTISHHNMHCRNKLDVLYFVVANFTWLLRASSKNHSYLRIKTTMIFRQVCCTFNKDRPLSKLI